MSGGHFNYNQYRINDIADSIEHELNRQGKEKPKDELYGDKEYFEKYPDEKYYYTYPETVQEKMREAVKQLKIAAVYAQRVDWFLSGDDGEENFVERLAEDLNTLTNVSKRIYLTFANHNCDSAYSTLEKANQRVKQIKDEKPDMEGVYVISRDVE